MSLSILLKIWNHRQKICCSTVRKNLDWKNLLSLYSCKEDIIFLHPFFNGSNGTCFSGNPCSFIVILYGLLFKHFFEIIGSARIIFYKLWGRIWIEKTCYPYTKNKNGFFIWSWRLSDAFIRKIWKAANI